MLTIFTNAAYVDLSVYVCTCLLTLYMYVDYQNKDNLNPF